MLLCHTISDIIYIYGSYSLHYFVICLCPCFFQILSTSRTSLSTDLNNLIFTMQFLTKLAITALFATPLLAAPIPIADADADAKADPINMDSLKGIFSNENRNPLIAGAAIGAVGAIGAKELYDHEFKKTTSTLVATATRVATATAA